MKSVALSEVKDDLSRYLRIAAAEDVVITRRGKAAGILIGFANEEDWFDYRLANDPRFTRRVEAARASLRAGHRIRFEDLEALDRIGSNHGRASPKRAGSVGRGRR